MGFGPGRPGRTVFFEQVSGGHPTVVQQLRRVGRRLGRGEGDRMPVQGFDAQGIQGHAAGHDLAPVPDGTVVPFEIESGLRIGPASKRRQVVVGRDGPAVAENQVLLQMENPRETVFGHFPVGRRGGLEVEIPVDPGQRLVRQSETEDLLVGGSGPVHEPVVQLEGAQMLVFRRCGVRGKDDAHGVDLGRLLLAGWAVGGDAERRGSDAYRRSTDAYRRGAQQGGKEDRRRARQGRRRSSHDRRRARQGRRRFEGLPVSFDRLHLHECGPIRQLLRDASAFIDRSANSTIRKVSDPSFPGTHRLKCRALSSGSASGSRATPCNPIRSVRAHRRARMDATFR